MSVTQFISRVERPGDSLDANIDSVPGPGSYNDSRQSSKLPGFVPFAGSSKRVMMGTEHRDTVAPGSYELQKNILPPSSSTASAFRSKAKRFEDGPESSMGPGPGSYMLNSDFDSNNKKNKKTLRDSKSSGNEILGLLNEVSICTRAPSIPARDQSYGYELGANGKLVMQDSVINGYKGQKGDTVGPGDYDPRYASKNRNTTKFSNARRPVLTLDPPQSTPGPGTYNSLSSFDLLAGSRLSYKTDFVVRLNEVKQRMSAAFESKSLRDPFGDEIKLNCAPGPGRYQVPEQTIKLSEARKPALQCFESTTERFANERTRANRLYTSPGDYDPLTSDFDQLNLKILKHKKMTSRSASAQNVAFSGAEKRFNEINNGICRDFVGDNGPAPGSYDPRTNLEHNLQKQNTRAGPFGSKAGRFVEKIESNGIRKGDQASQSLIKSLLGGEISGTYGGNEDKNFRTNSKANLQKRAKGLSAFGQGNVTGNKGRTGFREKDPDDAGPPPGRYDTSLSWKVGSISMNPSMSQSRKKPDLITPGPGQYPNALVPMGEGRRNRKDIFINTSARTPVMSRSQIEGPGPGEYNTSGSMVKQSHNAYLSGY